MPEHHPFVPSGHVGASEKPPQPWSGTMPELDKVQPEVSLLSAFSSTIAVALALGLPMALAIIWVCS